jgi:hypothetical protein
MKIKVTQEDIDNGQRKSCSCCPVALAMKRVLDIDVKVGDNKFVLTSSDEFTILELPKEARIFIDAFDNDELVEPFEFEINLPEWL